MHEMGTIMYVIKKVNEVCEEQHIDKVASVTLQVGEVSGIVPEYLKDFWTWAVKKEPRMVDCGLAVEEIKAFSRCGNCRHVYETVKFAKICPFCKSENTWLEVGNEYAIKDISVYETPDAPEVTQ